MARLPLTQRPQLAWYRLQKDLGRLPGTLTTTLARLVSHPNSVFFLPPVLLKTGQVEVSAVGGESTQVLLRHVTFTILCRTKWGRCGGGSTLSFQGNEWQT